MKRELGLLNLICVLVALGFLALMTAQVYAGLFHLTALHVPLAAALLVASLLYLLTIRSTRHHSSHSHLEEQAGSRRSRPWTAA